MYFIYQQKVVVVMEDENSSPDNPAHSFLSDFLKFHTTHQVTATAGGNSTPLNKPGSMLITKKTKRRRKRLSGDSNNPQIHSSLTNDNCNSPVGPLIANNDVDYDDDDGVGSSSSSKDHKQYDSGISSENGGTNNVVSSDDVDVTNTSRRHLAPVTERSGSQNESDYRKSPNYPPEAIEAFLEDEVFEVKESNEEGANLQGNLELSSSSNNDGKVSLKDVEKWVEKVGSSDKNDMDAEDDADIKDSTNMQNEELVINGAYEDEDDVVLSSSMNIGVDAPDVRDNVADVDEEKEGEKVVKDVKNEVGEDGEKGENVQQEAAGEDSAAAILFVTESATVPDVETRYRDSPLRRPPSELVRMYYLFFIFIFISNVIHYLLRCSIRRVSESTGHGTLILHFAANL
jgi:hypothetical protein